MVASRFGSLLRRSRLAAGLTQEQLAERAEVAVRTIRGFETGRQTNPRADTAARLADALGLDPSARTALLVAAFGHDTTDAEPATAEATTTAEPVTPAGPRRAAAPLPERLADAVEDLAHAVAARWRREEEQRRIQDPAPLPVRWQPAPEELTDHWANICRAPVGDTSGPLDLAGGLDEIVPIYRRIPSGRLVVLGRAGSGKTILALRFVLDLLATRAGADPVPVIVSLSSWHPGTTTLRDWLIGQLVRDHPGLAAPGPGGSTVAAALVEAGRILPVLDGFDEIADGLHRPALEALNATTLPLMLTSRRQQYAGAVAATDVLTAAATVELTDLTLADAGDYLRRTARRSTASDWDPVLAELDREPDSPAARNLTAVLTTPLMVTLARTVYSDATDSDPAALLDTDRFADPLALEDHLLDSFIPTVYQRPPATADQRAWEPHRVRHWLGTIARQLDRLGTRDIEWWRLGNAQRLRAQALLTGLFAGLALGGADLIADRVLSLVSHDPSLLKYHFGESALIGACIGLLAGLVFGLLNIFLARRGGVALRPARFELRLVRRRREVWQRFQARLGIAFGGGLLFGFGFGVLDTLVRVLWTPGLTVPEILAVGVSDGIVFALLIGLGAGLVGGLLAGFEAPLDIDSAVSPVSLLAANRRTVFVQLLVWVPVFGLVIGLGPLALDPVLRPFLGPLSWSLPGVVEFAFVAGVGGGVAYVASLTAWGQWVIFCRILLPLRGKLPWELVTFLDDAYRRGVLRQAGAVYQFRHARLQDRLTSTTPAPATTVSAAPPR